jgi:hypothetical protein
MTCEEIAEKTCMPLIKVRSIVREYPDDDDPDDVGLTVAAPTM